jgi:hypothetical protein
MLMTEYEDIPSRRMRALLKSNAVVAPPLRRASDAAAALLADDSRREEDASTPTFVTVCKELVAGIVILGVIPAFKS